MTAAEVDTPHGVARVHVRTAEAPRAALVLGHGAGGGVTARDIVAAADAANASGLTVVLVEQPYRVAGRRTPAPAHQLDTAWTAVVEHLREQEWRDLPIVTGGRSSGARVACRTSGATGAAGVLCLAFPLQPPPRRSGKAAPSRLPELDAVAGPVLVVQGTNDAFGMPPEAPARTVVQVAGDHSLRSAGAAVRAAVEEWLGRLSI